MLKTIIFNLIVCICTFLLLPAAAQAQIRLSLHWSPQAQFAGYYVALEKGFYREHGIDLVILPGGPDTVPADRLNSGEVEFATMFLAAALERRGAGIPLINICQIVQRSALMILTKKDDNITGVEDLQGRKVAMWANDFQLQPWALFRKHDVQVQVVPFSGSVELFLKGGVSASLAMWYNEYHTILASGYREKDLQPIFFKDTEFDFPEDGIYCLEDMIRTNPDLVASFIEATLAGWEYAFSHEQETLDIVRKYMEEANLPFARSHQRWMLNIMEIVTQPRDEAQKNRSGRLSSPAFATVAETLRKSGFSQDLPHYQDFVWDPSHVE